MRHRCGVVTQVASREDSRTTDAEPDIPNAVPRPPSQQQSFPMSGAFPPSSSTALFSLRPAARSVLASDVALAPVEERSFQVVERQDRQLEGRRLKRAGDVDMAIKRVSRELAVRLDPQYCMNNEHSNSANDY